MTSFKDFHANRQQTNADPTHFWGKKGAGVLVYCSATRRFLLGRRSAKVNEPGTWGLFGGAIDSQESTNRAAMRELEEEIGYRGEVILRTIDIFRKDNFSYQNFLGTVPEEFRPKLDWENDKAGWFSFENFPQPLHFGLKRILPMIKRDVLRENAQFYTEEVSLDLDAAFDVFEKEYIAATGKAWDKGKFMSRASNWTFYGDQNGYIAIRPQNSGFYKLVATAGSMKSKYKGFLEVLQLHIPLWGVVTKDIKDMLVKKGFKTPNKLEQILLKKMITSKVLGDAEILGYAPDGAVRLRYPDMGDMEKYLVGSPEYWKKLYSMKSAMKAITQ